MSKMYVAKVDGATLSGDRIVTTDYSDVTSPYA